jgi:hypothetical protein
MLTLNKNRLPESQFKAGEQSVIDATNAIHLFHRNCDTEDYNNMVFDTPNAIARAACDTLCGYKNNEQMARMRTKLHKMSVAETRGLPCVLKLLDKPYMITSNIDIDDSLVDGSVGTLKYIEWDDYTTGNELRVKRVWLHLQPNAVGKVARIKAHPYIFANPGIVFSDWSPMMCKTATITFKNSLNANVYSFP